MIDVTRRPHDDRLHAQISIEEAVESSGHWVNRWPLREIDARGLLVGLCATYRLLAVEALSIRRISAILGKSTKQHQNATIELPMTKSSATQAITPGIVREHGLIPEEYEKLRALLGGREPTFTELGIFSVMWSEHCSYKSSRVHLRRLPTRSRRVVQGPGENAGIIDIGDGWACAFKIESHNHPSFIEPFQGAATGVGGILRDIFTMGARPLAVMDSLRFGPITPGKGMDQNTVHKNHSILEGVVSGIASYGNCFGVPNLGGETKFEPCYSQNPLVNAFALGLVRRDEIFYARAAGEGNPVIYVGAKTGRDGIHGATMASEEFTEGSEQKR